jgi:hypothetical protein
MALIVQDDDGSIDNADSLVSVAEFEAYFTKRGKDYTNATLCPDATKEAALIRATDYLNYKYNWQGEKKSATQGTCFPRYYIYDLDGNIIDGIPIQVKQDCYELAAYMIDNSLTSLYSDIAGADANIKIQRDKVDVIETQIEYFGGISYDTLKVGNAQNSVRCGFLTYPAGIYL